MCSLDASSCAMLMFLGRSCGISAFRLNQHHDKTSKHHPDCQNEQNPAYQTSLFLAKVTLKASVHDLLIKVEVVHTKCRIHTAARSRGRRQRVHRLRRRALVYTAPSRRFITCASIRFQPVEAWCGCRGREEVEHDQALQCLSINHRIYITQEHTTRAIPMYLITRVFAAILARGCGLENLPFSDLKSSLCCNSVAQDNYVPRADVCESIGRSDDGQSVKLSSRSAGKGYWEALGMFDLCSTRGLQRR